MTLVYLITGANRGIGFSYVKELSKRPDVKIIATTRSVENSTELLQLKEETKNIEIVKLDVSLEESVDALDEQLKEVAPDGIDIYIGNAGIAQAGFTVIDAPRDVWVKHYKTNVLGPILVFQVLYPYLLKKGTRKAVFISSVAGSIGGYLAYPNSAYGQSKAALNYSVKEISSELDAENFTVLALHPGLVKTDMVKKLLEGLDKEMLKANNIKPIEPEDSVLQQLEVIDKSTRESNGKFFTYEGEEFPW
ncbi:uncharacterized oxidoreductase [[Candida] railenensis]|uniref:Uncharacterized oxidoreductase n=1 Tax=[Candida] railenensis TaxID=45579 RepID=A0A9P0QKX5_9ASCO|nr:uncharacterized oxidoreductase [[Candida] railenensis]